MGLDDVCAWHSSFSIETIDVLREVLQEDAVAMEELDEGVRDRGFVLSGIQLWSDVSATVHLQAQFHA